LKLKASYSDFDVLQSPNWVFIVVAENDSKITAFAIRQNEGKPLIIRKSIEIEGA